MNIILLVPHDLFFAGFISNAVVLQQKVWHASIRSTILLLASSYHRRGVTTQIRNSEAHQPTRWWKCPIQLRQLHGVLSSDSINVRAELFCWSATQRYTIQIRKGIMTRHFILDCLYLMHFVLLSCDSEHLLEWLTTTSIHEQYKYIVVTYYLIIANLLLLCKNWTSSIITLLRYS